MKQLYNLFFHPHPQFSPRPEPLFYVNLNLNPESFFSWILTCWLPRRQQNMGRSRYQTMLFEVLIQIFTSHFEHFRMEWPATIFSELFRLLHLSLNHEFLSYLDLKNCLSSATQLGPRHQAKCLGRKDLHYFQHCRYWFTICSLDCTSPFTKPDDRISGLEREPWHLGRSLSTTSLPDT